MVEPAVKNKKARTFYLSQFVADWLAKKKLANPHTSISSFVNEALEAKAIEEMENE
jgi:hypothetical protein